MYNYQKIASLTISVNGKDDYSILEYIKEIMSTLWREGESFSAKRPLGDSGWEYPVYAALVKHNLIAGKLGYYGNIEEVDSKMGDNIILGLIQRLGVV